MSCVKLAGFIIISREESKMIITNVVDGLWCPGQYCSSTSGVGLENRCDSNRSDSYFKMLRDGF